MKKTYFVKIEGTDKNSKVRKLSALIDVENPDKETIVAAIRREINVNDFPIEWFGITEITKL